MSNVKLGKLEDEDGNSITTELNDVEKILNRIGVPLRKSATEWNNFGDVLDQLSTKWKTLSGVDQSAIATALGGVRQKEAVLTMMENYDKVLQYEKTALESSGTAIKKYEEAYLGGIEAKSAAFKASFESLSMSIVNSGMIKALTDLGRGFLELLDGTDKMIPTSIRLAAVIIALTAAIKHNATASVIASAKSVGMMISMVGLKQAAIGTASAIWAATKSMLAFLATNPVGWAILVVGGLFSVSKAIDWLSKKLERTNEAMKESQESFKNAQSEIENVNKELSTTESRMAELRAIESPTLMEQEELTKLEEANAKLLLQIDYLKQKAEILKSEGKKAVDKAVSQVFPTYAQSTGLAPWETTPFGNENIGMAGAMRNTTSEYANAIKEIEMLTAKGDTATNKEKKRLKSLEDEMLRYKNKLMEYYETYSLIYDFYGSKDPLGRDAYEQMEKIMGIFGKSSSVAEKYASVMAKFPEITEIFKSMANAGRLNSENVSELLSQYPELSSELGKLEIGSDQLVNEFQRMATSISDVEVAASELKTSLDELSNTESLLQSISKEIEDSGSIGMGNITKMLESYPELSTVLAEYLAGISSAEDVYNGLQEIYQTDYNNSVSLLTAKLDTSEEYYTKLIESDNQYLKIMAENYGISLSDFKTLAEAKYAVEMKLLNALGFEWSKYYNIQSKTFTSTYVEAINSINRGAREKGLPYSSPEREQALAVQKALAQAAIDYENITYGSVNFSTIGNSFKTDDKGNEKDANKEAFEAQKAIIDRQLALNLITEEQYVNSLESLYKQYFADKSKYLEEYTQYEIEVYNKRQGFLEQAQQDIEALQKATIDMIKQEMESRKEALEDEKDSLKEAMDARQKALEKQKDNLKEYTDARKKALQDARDQDEYDKQVREKSKDIESIKAQLLGLSGDTSGAGMRKKKELNQALADAQSELSDTVSDRQYESQVSAIDVAYESQEKMLDAQIENINAVYEAQEKMLDAQIEGIDSFLGNQANLVQASFDRMNGMSSTLKNQLIAYNQEYGSGISNDIVKNWDAATEALMRYGSIANTYGTLTTITSSIGRPVGYATGTSGLKRDSIIVGTHELLLNKTGSNAYQMMNAGSPIFTEQQTNALKALLSSPSSLLTKTVGGVGLNNASTIMSMANSNNSQDIDLHYEFNISGTDPVGIESTIVKLLPKIKDYTLSAINKDIQFNKGVRLTAANMA